MLFKNLLKVVALAPLAVLAGKMENCADPSKIDTDGCKADILIVTTEERNAKQNEGFQSIVNTLERFSIPANQLTIPKAGVADNEIYRILYKDDQHTNGRYNAVVFPNGRVSYYNAPEGSSTEAMWTSALTWSQWQIFTDYSKNTESRIVYLNEYPSNNTGTVIAYENYSSNQQITLDQQNSFLTEELQQVQLDTAETWHYPARIGDENENKLTYGFDEVKPLLYFEPNDVIPEQTIAAVECNNQGAVYAGFFTSFGSWSQTAAALNIYWLTWALNGIDLEKVSDTHMSTQDALKSAAPKSIKLAFGCMALSTIFVIIATLI